MSVIPSGRLGQHRRSQAGGAGSRPEPRHRSPADPRRQHRCHRDAAT